MFAEAIGLGKRGLLTFGLSGGFGVNRETAVPASRRSDTAGW
jgi:hypothetical protein